MEAPADLCRNSMQSPPDLEHGSSFEKFSSGKVINPISPELAENDVICIAQTRFNVFALMNARYSDIPETLNGLLGCREQEESPRCEKPAGLRSQTMRRAHLNGRGTSSTLHKFMRASSSYGGFQRAVETQRTRTLARGVTNRRENLRSRRTIIVPPARFLNQHPHASTDEYLHRTSIRTGPPDLRCRS